MFCLSGDVGVRTSKLYLRLAKVSHMCCLAMVRTEQIGWSIHEVRLGVEGWSVDHALKDDFAPAKSDTSFLQCCEGRYHKACNHAQVCIGVFLRPIRIEHGLPDAANRDGLWQVSVRSSVCIHDFFSSMDQGNQPMWRHDPLPEGPIVGDRVACGILIVETGQYNGRKVA